MHTKNRPHSLWCPSLAGGCLQQGAVAVGELQRSHAWVLHGLRRAGHMRQGWIQGTESLLCRQTTSYTGDSPQFFPSQPREIMVRSLCGLIHAQHLLCATSSTVLHAVHETDPRETNPCLWYLIYWINDLIWNYCLLDISLKNTQRKTATVGTDIHLFVKHNVVHVGLGCMSHFLKLWIMNNLILV